jgi:PKD domain
MYFGLFLVFLFIGTWFGDFEAVALTFDCDTASCQPNGSQDTLTCRNDTITCYCDYDGTCSAGNPVFCDDGQCSNDNQGCACASPPPPPPPPTPTPTPDPSGSISVSSNDGGVSWCINRGVGCGSGDAFFGNLPLGWYVLSITGEPNNSSCSVDAASKNINPSNPDKTFVITCTANAPPAAVDILCNSAQACTIPFNGTANLSWSSSNASTCTASGGWSGSKGTSGTEARSNLTATQTFTLACSGPGGGGSDSVTATVPTNSRPLATNIRVTEPDYCALGPGGTISWTYSDPDGNPQSAYQVQVDTNAGFSSPDYDSGKVLSASNAATIPQGALTWNGNYRVRVLVWDSFDLQCLNWVPMSLCTGPGCAANQQSWTSPQHRYPSDVNTFSWTPLRPPINQLAAFSRGSVQCYQNPPNTPAVCAVYSWLFGDGTGASVASPSHAYANASSYTVTLAATEQQAGYSCSATKQITVQGPIPQWKEVFPQ